MKIYDEITKTEVTNPDLEAGYVYPVRRKVGTEERVLERTVTERRPEGLRHLVDVYEDCQYYHEYTEDELAAMQQPEEQRGDTEARLAALEDELAAAKILLGVE